MARDHCDLTDDNLHLCQTTFGRYVNADPSDDPGIEQTMPLLHAWMHENADLAEANRPEI